MSILVTCLIGVAIAASTTYGGKKAYDGYQYNTEAQKVTERANSNYKRATDSLKIEKDSTTKKLEELGLQKLEISNSTISNAVDLIQSFRDVQWERDEFKQHQLNNQDFVQQMKEIKSMVACTQELVKGGLGSLGTGVLVGLGSYSLIGMLGTASTGTAIGTLSGVCATNATLAWLGGGSLAAGGFGMAGGIAVLGGIVAAPIIAIGGSVWAAHCEKKLAEARSTEAKINIAVQEMSNAQVKLKAIKVAAGTMYNIRYKLEQQLKNILSKLEKVVDKHSEAGFVNYRILEEVEKRQFYVSWEMTKLIKNLLEFPILLEDGSLNAAYQNYIDNVEQTSRLVLE